MLRIFIAVTVFAVSSAGGTLWSAPAYAQLQCRVDPQILSPLPDGKSYALVLGSLDQAPAQLDVSLYSASREYRVEFRDVRFDTPSDRGFAARSRRPFQSRPRFIVLPNSDELTLVIVNPLATASPSPEGRCDSFLYTELALAHQRPRYSSPGSVIMEASRLSELAGSNSGTPALLVGQTPFACAEPFAEVRAVHLVPPVYPDAARRGGTTGTVQVKLTIDASGMVSASSIYKSSQSDLLDGAALASARATTYSPARARCIPSGGGYLFRADFTSH
jgi:TonB family protein